MTHSEVLTIRARPEHAFVLDVICEAEGIGRSTAMRLLIEQYGERIRNADLVAAVPEELHGQLPTLWSDALTKPRPFDPDADAHWVTSVQVLTAEVEE